MRSLRKFLVLLSFAIATMGVWTGSASAAERRFLSDDIVVYGKDAAGHEFLLDVMLCRKEEAEKASFIHYRFISLIYNGINKHITESFYDPDVEEKPYGILKSFENRKSSDLSARESYSFTVTVDNQDIQVQIPELEGDFIVKNSLEFTKYVSESRASVLIGGKVITARAVATKIYSMDYSKYVFFPGYGQIPSETHSFVLWDDQANFYLIDTSTVEKENPGYRSHTWVLMKDTAGKTMRKAFDVHVALKQLNGRPDSWVISVPGLDDRKIRLKAVVAKEGKPQEGFASGNVTVQGRSVDARGLYVHRIHPDS